MTSRGTSPKTPRMSPKITTPEKRSDDEELAKKALYSALILLGREQLKEKQDREKQTGTDDFWSRIQAIINKHESQMDEITVQAVNVRSKLNNRRLEESKAHSERMSKAKTQYQKILEELEMLSQDQTKQRITDLTQRQSDLQHDIDEISANNVRLNESVENLTSETEEMKKNLRTATSTIEARSSKIKARRQVSTESASKIDAQISQLTNELASADNEIEELKEKREMVKQLVETLETSKSHIQSIFMPNE